MNLPIKFTERDDILTRQVKLLIEKISPKLRVSLTHIHDALQTHPDYPSMNSVSEVLESIGIQSAALYVGADQISEMPLPFLAHLKSDDTHFGVVLAVKDDNVVYSNGYKVVRESQDEFGRRLGGAVLIAEAPENVEYDEESYYKNRVIELWQNALLPIYSLVILVGVWGGIKFFQAQLAFPYFIFGLVGFVLSSSLLIIQHGGKESRLGKLCGISEAGDCSSILQSESSTIFGLISWAQIGFFYFLWIISSFVLYFLQGELDSMRYLSIILSFCPVFYSAYSLYYQYAIAKMWCILCVGVQCVLIITFLYSLNFIPLAVPTRFDLAPSIYAFFASLSLTHFFDFFLKGYFEKKILRKDLNRFLTNSSLFEIKLARQDSIPNLPKELPVLRLGAEEAQNVITFVTNPFCKPCEAVHEGIDLLLSKNSNIKIEILILATENSSDSINIVADYWQAMFRESGAIDMSLKSWFSLKTKSIDSLDKSRLNSVSEIDRSNTKEIAKWLYDSGIYKTPTLFVNGKKFPEPYKVSDLIYIGRKKLKC